MPSISGSRPSPAFVTDVGGATSHRDCCALAGIPAVVALHNARSLIREAGRTDRRRRQRSRHRQPDQHVLAEYSSSRAASASSGKAEAAGIHRAVTLDGMAVDLNANISCRPTSGLRGERCRRRGPVPQRFLFMRTADLPTEDEQFEAYRAVVEGVQGRPVTIRTFDLGADKRMPGLGDRQRTPRSGCVPFAFASPSRNCS